MAEKKVELKETLTFGDSARGSRGSSDGSGKRNRVEAERQRLADIAAAKAAADAKRAEAARQKRLQQYQQSGKETEKKRIATEEVSTGIFTRGGMIVQEYRGDYKSLKEIQAGRPKSQLVQDKAGKYVLVEARGIDLGAGRNLQVFNERSAQEGGPVYTPTQVINEKGGIDFKTQLRDQVEGDNSFSGLVSSPGGTAYSVSLGGTQGKTRPAQPREIAEMISEGKIEPRFIGGMTNISASSIREQQRLAKEQQKFTESKTPQTYVDSSGREIVTITGQSPGSQFQILKSVEKPKTKQSANSVLSLLESDNTQKGKSSLEYAKESYVNIGIDILSTELTQYGQVPRPEIKNFVSDIREYRKESQVDLLLQPERWGEIDVNSPEFAGSTFAYASLAAIGYKPNLPKIKLPQKPQTIKQPVPQFKQTIMKDIFKSDTGDITTINLGQSKPMIPLRTQTDIGSFYTPQPTSKLPKITPPKPNVKIDPNYQVPRVPVSKDPTILNLPPEFTSVKIKTGIATGGKVEKVQTDIGSYKKITTGKSPRTSRQITDEPTPSKINLGKGSIGRVERIQTDIGSYKQVTPSSQLARRIQPKTETTNITPETRVGLGKGSIGKVERIQTGDITSKLITKPLSKFPLTNFGKKIPQDVLYPKDPFSTKISLGKGSIGKVERIQTDIGSYKQVKPISKFPLTNFGKQTSIKNIEIDPNYRVSKLPISRDPSVFTKDDKYVDFWTQKRSLGTGLGKQIKGSQPDKPKRFIKRPPPTSREDEIRVTKGMIAIMEKPKKPFTTTKVNLGKSEQTLQIKDGKIIQDSIRKSKPSNPPFSIPPSSPTTSYGQPSVFPPVKTASGLSPFIISPIQNTEGITQTKTQTPIDIKIDLKPKIKMNIDTKPGQITGQRGRQNIVELQKTTTSFGLKPLQKQGQKFARPEPSRTPSKTRSVFKEGLKEKPLQKQIIEEIPPKEPIIKLYIPPPPEIKARRIRKPQPPKRRKKVDFLGGSSVETVEGLSRKSDIIVGRKSSRALARRVSKERKSKKKLRIV